VSIALRCRQVQFCLCLIKYVDMTTFMGAEV
jgi:hypothetical protein